MTTHARVLVCLALLAAGLTVCQAAAARPLPAYFKDPSDQSARQRPTYIGFHDLDLYRLRWTGWGQRHATAGGRARINTCNPTCAAGRIVFGRANVIVYRLQRVGARRYYTCVKGAITGLPPGLPAYLRALAPFCRRIG